MAGHSKWANIKHRKAAQDAKKGKVFTKLIREITVSAKTGDPDPNANPRLRLAVDKALAQNMSRDTIDRAIKRGAGTGDTENLDEIRYEGYGPNGVAIMVDCLTDNRNRTVSEVRHAFTKCGGNLGTDGSVSYLFSKSGMLSFAPGCSEERIMEVAIEAGADDVVKNEDDSIDVMIAPENYLTVKAAMEAAKLIADNAEVTMVAANTVNIDDKEDAQAMVKLLEMLEDLDDVQNVYSNANIDEALLEE